MCAAEIDKTHNKRIAVNLTMGSAFSRLLEESVTCLRGYRKSLMREVGEATIKNSEESVTEKEEIGKSHKEEDEKVNERDQINSIKNETGGEKDESVYGTEMGGSDKNDLDEMKIEKTGEVNDNGSGALSDPNERAGVGEKRGAEDRTEKGRHAKRAKRVDVDDGGIVESGIEGGEETLMPNIKLDWVSFTGNIRGGRDASMFTHQFGGNCRFVFLSKHFSGALIKCVETALQESFRGKSGQKEKKWVLVLCNDTRKEGTETFAALEKSIRLSNVRFQWVIWKHHKGVPDELDQYWSLWPLSPVLCVTVDSNNNITRVGPLPDEN